MCLNLSVISLFSVSRAVVVLVNIDRLPLVLGLIFVMPIPIFAAFTVSLRRAFVSSAVLGVVGVNMIGSVGWKLMVCVSHDLGITWEIAVWLLSGRLLLFPLFCQVYY